MRRPNQGDALFYAAGTGKWTRARIRRPPHMRGEGLSIDQEVAAIPGVNPGNRNRVKARARKKGRPCCPSTAARVRPAFARRTSAVQHQDTQLKCSGGRCAAAR